MSEELNEHMRVRREKLDAYRTQGLDPFGGKFERTAIAKELQEQFESFSKDELEEKAHQVTIAGRMMTKRGKGKADLRIFKI